MEISIFVGFVNKIDVNLQVKVYIQLVRPSDGDTSDPVEFRYKPSTASNGKRFRPDSFYDLNIPVPVVENQNAYIQKSVNCYVPRSNTLVDDNGSDIQELLKCCESELALSPEGNFILDKDQTSDCKCTIDFL